MDVGLNFGLTLSEFSPDQMRTIACDAERLGYRSLWCGDHLILPPTIPLRDMSEPDKPVSEVVPSNTTRVIFEPQAPMPDVLTVFAHMAAGGTVGRRLVCPLPDAGLAASSRKYDQRTSIPERQ